MKKKIKRAIDGSISVLLIIILTPILSLAAIIVDTSRINMAKSMISSSGDLAMNSALANYDTILKDVYGLFAMSQGESKEELAENIKEYFADTLVSYNVVDEKNADDYVENLMGDFVSIVDGTYNIDSYKNFLNMTVSEDFTAEKVSNSSLANTDIMRSQIIEYMKYRAPISVGESFFDAISSFKNVGAQTDVVEAQVSAQQASQPVAESSDSTIDKIREYDKDVEAIWNHDTKTEKTYTDVSDKIYRSPVSGKAYPSDSEYIVPEEYQSQIVKYKYAWGDFNTPSNYTRINEIYMIFLLKSPVVDSTSMGTYYLSNGKKLIVIDPDTSKYTLMDNYNIDITGVNIQTTTDLDTAKSYYESQAALLADGSDLKAKASNYVSSKFVPGTYANSTDFIAQSGKTTGKVEEDAENAFIDYEIFLLSQGDSDHSKYSEVKKVFEGLVSLQKYFEQYIERLNEKIAYYTGILTDATTTKNNIEAAQKKISGKTSAYGIEDINNETDKYNEKIDSSNKDKYDKNYDYNELKSDKKGLSKSDIDTIKSEMGTALSKQYTVKYTSAYYNDYQTRLKTITNLLKENDKYGNLYKQMESNKIVPSDSKTYYDSTSGYYTNINKLENLSEFKSDDPLCNALNYLYKNACRINSCNKVIEVDLLSTAETSIKTLNNKMGITNSSGISQLERCNTLITKANEKITEYTNQKTGAENSHSVLLKEYVVFTNRYSEDIGNYNNYKKTAKAVIQTNITNIHNQYNAIKDNVAVHYYDLLAIKNSLDTVYNNVKTYQEKIDDWEKANNTYTSSAGSDTFSNQNSNDIKQMDTEYNLDAIDTLRNYTQALCNVFKAFYDYMNGDNFKYNGKAIKDITKTDDLSTINSGKKNSLPSIVTSDDADEKAFSYENETPPTLCYGENDYNAKFGTYNFTYSVYSKPNKFKFLSTKGTNDTPSKSNPLPNAFLNYLNNTYPETAPVLTNSEGEADTTDYKGNYNTTKENLTGSGDINEEVKSDADWGYNLDDFATIEEKDKKSGDAIKLDIKKDGKDGDDIDASSGVSSQSEKINGSSGILSGIGNIAGTALENAYILDYIFENFSYNTFVQDSIAEKLKVSDDDAWTAFSKISAISSDYNNTKDKVVYGQTLSKYDISNVNNKHYGAEIEYMLYGNNQTSLNLLAAKASIYAIRFGFDCIYAFTNSEVRNIARTVGLAVQAATLGIVPYQIVMVVVQLALAAGEAALDLSMICNGIDVVVVKTGDTWMLSAENAGKGIVKAAGSYVAEEVVKDATTAIADLTTAAQEIVDEAGNIATDKVDDLIDGLQNTAEGAVQGALDDLCTTAETSINTALNTLQYTEYQNMANGGKQEAKNAVTSAFSAARSNINSYTTGVSAADSVISTAKTKLISKLDAIETEVKNDIDGTDVNINAIISEKMAGYKEEVNSAINGVITDCSASVKTAAEDSVVSVKNEINSYVGTTGEKLSEKAADNLRNSINGATNKFVDNLGTGKGSNVGSGIEKAGGSTNKSLASAIKFGYKEYLMLFVYIKICVNDDDVMTRLGKVIEENLNHSTFGYANSYKEQAADKKFSLANAFTYVHVYGNVKLDMLLVNLGFFNQFADNGNSEEGTEVNIPAQTIYYNGLLGY